MRLFPLDTETTAASPGGRIVEIAIGRVDANEPAPFCSRVNPGMPIPEPVTRIHGITDAHVAGAPDTREALLAAVDYLIEQAPDGLLIHNAGFDCRIVQWECDRVGVDWPQELPVFCTLEHAQARAETKNNRLETLADHYGLATPWPPHSAIGDCHLVQQYAELLGVERGQPRPWREWVATARGGRYSTQLPEGFEAFPELVAAGGRFSFDYRDERGKETRRTIIPAGWADCGGFLSFHGFCLLRNDMREFRSDRVVAVQSVAF